MEPVTVLRWVGKVFDFDLGRINNLEGGLAVGLAKWLVLPTGACTRKKLASAVGKFRWLGAQHTTPHRGPLQ